MPFIHLHNHSDYSLLDGACRLDGLVQTAVDHKSPAIALTDHGNMYGMLDFYTRCLDAGIKPIVGCELYVAPNSRLEKRPGPSGEQRYHLILLAKNSVGYKNLTMLCSEGFLSGFYYKPRIDRELLAEYHDGLICLSGCIQGEIPKILLAGKMEEACDTALFYKKLFGDDYYFEIQRHGIDDEERILPLIAEISEDLNIKMVATNDAHYLKREHAAAHDVLLCVGTQSHTDDENRLRFQGEEFYLKSPEEMTKLFEDYPETLTNTLEISEKCNLEIKLDQQHFPVFELPESANCPDEYLAKLSSEGLQNRFPNEIPEDAHERLRYELSVIKQTGFANYFLITADFVQWAKDHDIPVGPGRGSAAGCLVSYCLAITNIDPLAYDLLFERFLNPERISPPDIDIDFADNRREEVISYVKEKYGEDSVCRITTFGKMAARSCVRDIARVTGMTYAEGDKIAKMIPESVREVTLQSAISQVPDLKILIDSDKRFKELVDHALILEGTVRNAGTHAAGVVICPGPAVNYIPIYKQTDDEEIYTQYDMNWIDRLGLLKMDFLGLQTLQEIDLTLKALKVRGIEIDFDSRNQRFDDAETYKMIGEGDTIGVFQFESGGMRDNLTKLKPECLEDLLAMCALYRPGPMSMIPEFIECKHGRKEVSYLHPSLEPILKNTYGVIVYQEQVMRIATDLGGFSLGKADILRKAMGKKKMELMQAYKDDFITGCEKNDVSKKIAQAIFSLMEHFASYGFVKAHAVGYAMIAYQCAFLKCHYTSEYLASCLTVRSRNSEQIMKLLAECRSHKIRITAPDINESEKGFKATDQGVKFGLSAIKNVGHAAVNAILTAREETGSFSSIHHFLSATDLRVINKKVVESLIDAGAFDGMGENRATLLASLPGAAAYASAVQDDRIKGQRTLFGTVGDEGDGVINLPLPELHIMDKWSESELQAREKAVLGYYITSHPLESLKLDIEGLATHNLADKDEFRNDQRVKVCAVVVAVQVKSTRRGGRMAILKLEDLTGSIEVLLFPKSFDSYNEMLQVDSLVGITGRVSRSDKTEEPKIILEDVMDLELAVEKWSRVLRIKLPSNHVTAPLMDRLESLFMKSPGDCALYIDLTYPHGNIKTLKLDKFKVKPASELVKSLRELVGDEQVTLGRM